MTTTDPSASAQPAPPAAPPPSQAAPTAPLAAAPIPAPAQRVTDDVLARLANQDIPLFRNEMREMSDPSNEDIRDVLQGTVMSLLQALAVEVLRLRSWTVDTFEQHAGGYNELADRFDNVEQIIYGADSQLTEEDGTLFMQCIVAAQALAEQARIASPTAEGRAKADEILASCKRAAERVNEITMTGDEDDDDDDDAGS